MATASSRTPNVYAHRGRHLLSAYHARHAHIPLHKLSKMTPGLRNPDPTDDNPICIIGAGMAGLYTAMILKSLGISYELVDADDQKRVGGRVFTYHFPNGGKYDYYDVGAMRFPDTPFMKRTFDLAQNRGLENVKLIPYIMKMVNPPNTWLFYNNQRAQAEAPSLEPDPFGVSGYVVDKSLLTPDGVEARVGEIINPFRDLFKQEDIASAMDNLFKATNLFSLRSYMFTRGMNPKDVHWCETLDKSTGWYDRALTETVIESLAFDWPFPSDKDPKIPSQDPNAVWKCFDGGSSTLPQAVFKSLSGGNFSFNSPVTAISHDTQKEVMNISINGVQTAKEYSAVICTVPLPRLSLMDLTGVGINDNYAQWSAIRELQYGPSIKIGMMFSTPWWETEQQIRGGQSKTDLPIRTIVYPSYPDETKDKNPDDRSKVLIVSYCWTQDAERLGALINPDGTARDELINRVLTDLAAVHPNTTVEALKKSLVAHHAWDWLHDPLTMGAFAFFGPGVYDSQDIYSELLQPVANGKLFFAGEAASACHAWVAGALDSAWRAVYQYLHVNQPNKVEDFQSLWGKTEYWDEASDDKLVELNRKLMERHLVIGLWKDGVRPV